MSEFIEIDGHRLTEYGAYWDGPTPAAPWAIGDRRPYILAWPDGFSKGWFSCLPQAYAAAFRKAVSAGWRLLGICPVPFDVFSRKDSRGCSLSIYEQWKLSVPRASRGKAMLSPPAIIGDPKNRQLEVREAAEKAYHDLRESLYLSFGAPTFGVLDEFQRADLADEALQELADIISSARRTQTHA